MALNPNSVVGTAWNNLKGVKDATWETAKQGVRWGRDTGTGAYESVAGTGAASAGLTSRFLRFVIDTVGGVAQGSLNYVRKAFDPSTTTGRIARPLLIVGALVGIYKIGEIVLDKWRHKARAEAQAPIIQDAAARIAAAEARIERAHALMDRPVAGHDFSYLGASHPAHGRGADQWRSGARGQVPAELGQGQ